MHPGARLTTKPSHHLTVPTILELLELIHLTTREDVVLGSVARTVEQAIDELSALRQAAMDVMDEIDAPLPPPVLKSRPTVRRRLC